MIPIGLNLACPQLHHGPIAPVRGVRTGVMEFK